MNALIEDPSTNALATERGPDGSSVSAPASRSAGVLEAGCTESRSVEGSSVSTTPAAPTKPRQLVFECKLKDCSATLELRTLGGKDGIWTQLTAAVFVKPKKGRAPTYQQKVRIAFALADLSICYLSLWNSSESFWLGSAAFDVDRTELPRLTEFLVSLGVLIEDNRKGSGS